MSIQLRPYQNDMVCGLRYSMRDHRRIMLQLPTGGGKTAIATNICELAASKGKRIYFNCHRRELVDQTYKTFSKYGLDVGFIAAGKPMNLYAPIQICSVDTLKNRIGKIPQPDIAIWDEAHHIAAAGWTAIQAAWDKSFHVGLSATPWRLNGEGLNQQFDHLIQGPQPAWMIEQGFLADYKLYSVPGVDMSGAKKQMGDYAKNDAETAMTKPSIMGDVVGHWQKYASDKLTIGFAVSIRHSKLMVEQFKAAGIPAAHIDGETETNERRRLLRDLATGKLRVVFNVGLFGEGYDIAANSGMDVTIGCVIDCAPTHALNAWLQRCGRALRPQEGHAIILDHGGNALKHGLPCQYREWSLLPREKPKRGGKKKEDDEPNTQMKQCEKCYYCYPPLPECPACGHVPEVGRVVKEVQGELSEVDPTQSRLAAKREQGQARTEQQLIDLGRKQGHKNPEKRAQKIIEARKEKAQLKTRLANLLVGLRQVGITPPVTNAEVAKMTPKPLKTAIAECEALLNGTA